MRRFRDSLRLMRWENCCLAAVGVYVGAYLTWLTPTYYGPIIASVAGFLVCGGGNIVNDLVDIEIDRVNRPWRLLVRGVLSTRYAASLAILMNVGAIVLALAVNQFVAVLTLVTIVLLLLYNFRLKRVPLAGNAIIAGLGGMTFLAGGLAADEILAFSLPGPVIAAVFAFFFHLVREIVKDVQDIDGDRRAGLRTLPLVIGVQKSLWLALLLFVVLVLLTYLPVLAGWFGTCYLIIAVYAIDLPILLLLILVLGNPSPRMLRLCSPVLKAGMGLGLVALVLA